MSNQQYVIGNAARTDASAFTVPGDEDGGEGDDSFPVDESGAESKMHIYVHVDNGWDQNVDVTLRGSHYLDGSMASATDDGAAETINSGTTGAFDSEVGHSFAEVNVDPASAPTSGDLTVTFQVREV